MDALAHYARRYDRGSEIPSDIWNHADIVSDYLGYPPARQWLWRWLNEREKDS